MENYGQTMATHYQRYMLALAPSTQASRVLVKERWLARINLAFLVLL
jgi:hypothetical protein